MTDTDGDRRWTVLFWRAIDLFSPQLLPRPDPRNNVEDVYPGEPMPWEPGSRLSTAPVTPGKVWRHEVFGCTVDADGLLVEESAVLSACAWAIGRACSGGQRGNWLSGFDQDVLHFGDQLAKLTGADLGAGLRFLAASMQEAVPAAVEESRPAEPAKPPARLDTHPLTGADVQRFTDELGARTRVIVPLAPRGVGVRSYQISATRAGEAADSSFLNSFLADDLARVARALRGDDIGPGLRDYLTSNQQLGGRTRQRTWRNLGPSGRAASRTAYRWAEGRRTAIAHWYSVNNSR